MVYFPLFSQKIRAIYNGSCSSLDNDLIDLPTVLPRPPIVGQKIYARVRAPKDGIYAATVINFKKPNIPICIFQFF